MIQQFVVRSDDLIFREVDGDVIVIGGDGRQMHMLNETASLIWKCVDGGATVLQVEEKIA